MEIFFGLLTASTKLEALLVHVPDVLRGEIGVHVINCFKEIVKPGNI